MPALNIYFFVPPASKRASESAKGSKSDEFNNGLRELRGFFKLKERLIEVLLVACIKPDGYFATFYENKDGGRGTRCEGIFVNYEKHSPASLRSIIGNRTQFIR